MDNFLWFIVVAIGPLILGGAIAYGMFRRRRWDSATLRRRKEATEELYRGE